jgi:hypothetical protein
VHFPELPEFLARDDPHSGLRGKKSLIPKREVTSARIGFLKEF